MFFVNLTLGQFAVLMTSATAFLLAIYLLERARRIADGTVRGSGRLGAWSGVW